MRRSAANVLGCGCHGGAAWTGWTERLSLLPQAGRAKQEHSAFQTVLLFQRCPLDLLADTHTQVYTRAQTHTQTHTHTQVYTHRHTHTHTQVYTHTHTHTDAQTH